jgi:hypothetical protein
MPVMARNIQSLDFFGSGTRRTKIIVKIMSAAITNLIPAKVSGGRSWRPSLMNSQVEPQMQHKSSQTRRDFITEIQPYSLRRLEPNLHSLRCLGVLSVSAV